MQLFIILSEFPPRCRREDGAAEPGRSSLLLLGWGAINAGGASSGGWRRGGPLLASANTSVGTWARVWGWGRFSKPCVRTDLRQVCARWVGSSAAVAGEDFVRVLGRSCPPGLLGTVAGSSAVMPSCGFWGGQGVGGEFLWCKRGVCAGIRGHLGTHARCRGG